MNIFLLATPYGRSRSKIFAFIERDLSKRDFWQELFFFRKPRWAHHSDQHLLLDGDAPLLREQQRFLQQTIADGYGGAWRKSYTLATNSRDNMIVLFRKWLDKNVDTMPWRTAPEMPGLMETMSKEEIGDRYFSHTKDCVACRGAMRRMNQLKIMALLFAVICGVHVVSSVSVAVALYSIRKLQSGSSGVLLLVGTMHPVYMMSIIAAAALLPFFVGAFVLLAKGVQNFVYTDLAHKLAHAE